MSFGLIRVRTISSTSVVAAAEKHNSRTEKSRRDNIDNSLSKNNSNYGFNYDNNTELSYNEIIEKRYNQKLKLKQQAREQKN